MVKRDLAYWVELLFRRSATLRLILLAVLVPVALVSLVWPPLYESQAKILLQSNQQQVLVSPGFQEEEGTSGLVTPIPVTEQDLNSESELLTSPDLIEAALIGANAPVEGGPIKALAVAASRFVRFPDSIYAAIHGLPRLTDRDELALKLAPRINVAVIKRSNVLEVSFRSHNYTWAQVFLERLIAQYLALHARISHDPQAEQFFETQAKLLNDKLHSSEERLRAAELQTGITSLEDQKEALVEEFYELDEETRKERASVSAADHQVTALEAQIDLIPKFQHQESRVVQNMALSQLKPEILQMEADRAELLSRYQPTSNRIQEIDARIAAAKAILDHEDRTQVQETTEGLNPTWAELDSRLAEARAAAASTQASSKALEAELAQASERMKALTSDGLLIEAMQREVDSAKEAYLSYVRKGEEARAAEALNQRRILNVSVAQPPTAPLLPVFPMLGINLAAAVLLGLLLGLLAAFLEEQRDSKIYSARTVADASGLPTIAVLDERS